MEYSNLVNIDENRRVRFKVLAEMREQFEGVPSEEIEREVAQAIAEVRLEKRLLSGGQVRRLATEEHSGEEVG